MFITILYSIISVILFLYLLKRTFELDGITTDTPLSVEMESTPQDEEFSTESITSLINSTNSTSVTDSTFKEISTKVTAELTPISSRKGNNFLSNDIDAKIEAIVIAKLNEKKQTETDESTLSSELESRLKVLEQYIEPSINKLHVKIDTQQAIIDDRDKQIKLLYSSMEKLEKSNQELRNINSTLKANESQMNSRIEKLENNASKEETRVNQLEDRVEDEEKYSRRETLEFHGIPYEREGKNEDCYRIIQNFCAQYLDIEVRKFDMSIAHRQFNPKEKRKLGKNYIPSIYVRFVNRFLADNIFEAKYRLKNERNQHGNKLFIKRNLTFLGRELWELTLAKLTDFRYKWFKYGTIYVKKSDQDKAIVIKNAETVNNLLHNDNNNSVRQATEQEGINHLRVQEDLSPRNVQPKQQQMQSRQEYSAPQPSAEQLKPYGSHLHPGVSQPPRVPHPSGAIQPPQMSLTPIFPPIPLPTSLPYREVPLFPPQRDAPPPNDTYRADPYAQAQCAPPNSVETYWNFNRNTPSGYGYNASHFSRENTNNLHSTFNSRSQYQNPQKSGTYYHRGNKQQRKQSHY